MKVLLRLVMYLGDLLRVSPFSCSSVLYSVAE